VPAVPVPTLPSPVGPSGVGSSGDPLPGSLFSAYQVQLTWQAPAASADPVAGYEVWRATVAPISPTMYFLLNSAIATYTVYVDNAVAPGFAYSYYVTSVDAQGNQSGPSNIYTVEIP
jgi:hypothetical protein